MGTGGAAAEMSPFKCCPEPLTPFPAMEAGVAGLPSSGAEGRAESGRRPGLRRSLASLHPLPHGEPFPGGRVLPPAAPGTLPLASSGPGYSSGFETNREGLKEGEVRR